MLEAGKTYKYFYAPDQEGNDVTVEMIIDDVAIATSGSVGGMGPFTMKFDVETGCGLGEYRGTHLVMD